MKNYVMVISFLFFTSCEDNRLKVDVEDVNVPEVNIKRLEQDMFNMKPQEVESATSEMIKKYGNFYIRFVTNIINKGGLNDSSYSFNLRQFIADKDMRKAYEQTQAQFKDVSWIKEDLTEAFKYYKHHFPQREIPEVVTYMSGFNYSIVNVDSVLGIGLEMYLGSDNEFYKMIQFPNYRTVVMRKEYIIPDCVKGWMATEFANKMNKADFLSEIIYQGKIMYLTDALLPDAHDTLKVSYTKEQLEWCRTNEANMWAYFLEQKLLYSGNYTEISKFTMEAPFTSAFSKESPGRVGTWVGWQIIRKYMEKNEDVTLQQLMDENDAQLILAKSKYKPK